MKKVKIRIDEVYPVFSLEDDLSEYGSVIEVEETFFSEYLEIEEKWYDMQNKLGKLSKLKRLT